MPYTIILKSKLLMIINLLFAICFVTIYTNPYLKTESAYGQESDQIHVSIGIGNNIDSCGSTENPCRSLQFAINKANSGDEILVAGGTYTDDGSSDACSNLGTTAVVCIRNQMLTLKGGYSDTDWSQQNITTTIDGENIHQGVLVIDTSFATGLNMDGFTIQNGIARGIKDRSGDDAIFAYGGGMFVERAEEITLSNLIFKDNRAHGENTDTPYGGSAFGGGLALRGFAARQVMATLDNVTFDNNQARGGSGAERGGQGYGGGMYGVYATVNGNDIKLHNNSTRGGDTAGEGETSDGLRADAMGAGASFRDGTKLELQNVSAHGNRATGGNGSQYAGGAFGAGISIQGSSAILTDMTLLENVVQGGQGFHGGIGRGGGAEFRDSAVEITNLIAVQNQATGGDGTNGDRGSAAGGGLSMSSNGGQSALLDVTNGVIAGNVVTLGQGVQMNRDDVEANTVGGAGLLIQSTQVRLDHITIADNQLLSVGMNGSALLLAAVDQQGSDVSLTNCIIANHTSYAIYMHPSNTFTPGRCLWFNNSNDINAALSIALNGNPDFVDAPSYNYRIMPSSAAIDQAEDSTVTQDVAGNIRNGIADLGAYEAADTLPSLTPVPTSTATNDIVDGAGTPVVTPIVTLEATPIVPSATPGPIPPDRYEDDNSCEFFRGLKIDDDPQAHTFHESGDEDWLGFNLQVDATYRLLASSINPDIQIQIEVYEACDQRLDLPTTVNNGEGFELTFEAQDSGQYYARIWNSEENLVSNTMDYEISISELEGSIAPEGDLAIIITGHDDSHSLQQNIFHAANIAYRSFRSAGIPKHRIRYLGLKGDERGDADRDERSDVKVEATVANVQETITQWAVARVNSESRVFIYMMDHGLEDFLKLNGDDDQLWADELDGWLDQLEDATGASVAVIYEACLSGSFITGDKSISKDGRLVIASTDDEKNAFAIQNGGAHFSDAFFSALQRGVNFADAFDVASKASLEIEKEQDPMLDANGDGQYTLNDKKLACAWKLSDTSELNCNEFDPLPLYFTLNKPDEIVDGRGVIQVRDHKAVSIDTIRADVYRPDFTSPAVTTDGTMPALEIDRVEFSGPNDDGIYTGEYDRFDMDGTYRFIIYGADSMSDMLISERLDVVHGEVQPPSHMVYLPTIQR